MNESLAPLLKWMKTTDLVELAYRRGSRGVELRLAGAEPILLPETTLVPVGSPAVGVFQAAEPGKAGVLEGSAVQRGDVLGFIESRGGRSPVSSPAQGFLAKILAESGKPIQYGQPLFLIEPR